MTVRLEEPTEAAVKLENLKQKRSFYTAGQKRKVVDLVNAWMAEGMSKRDAIKKLKIQNKGFDKVNRKMVDDWSTARPRRKVGRKVPGGSVFRDQVLAELVYAAVEKVDNVEQAVVVANATYSHAIIQQAARAVQGRPAFADDKAVQKLQFSRPWIRGFLKYAVMRKKRVTAKEKKLLPVEVV